MTEVHGTTADGFTGVGEAFQRNFDEFGEVGAACCVYVDGDPVVDVWGGLADQASGRNWESDGKIVSGTFEAHQISDGLVHTRQVQSDGTVVTGKMTRVSAQ